MAQCHIDDAFVEIKMIPRCAKQELKTSRCLKTIFEKRKAYTVQFKHLSIQGSFLSLHKVQVLISKKPPSTTFFACLH